MSTAAANGSNDQEPLLIHDPSEETFGYGATATAIPTTDDIDDDYDGYNDYESFITNHSLSNGKGNEEKYGLFQRWWSQVTFGWMNQMFVRGNEVEQLSADDLKSISLDPLCQSKYVSSVFDKCWKDELARVSLKGQDPSLGRALAHAFGGDFLRAGILKLVHDMLIFVGPQVLNGLISFFRKDYAPLSEGLWLTLAVTCSQLTMSLCLRQYFFRCFKTGLQLRSAVVIAVYKKGLVLSSAERQLRSSGEITNLMSVDAQRLQDLTSYLHAIWYSFIQIGLSIFFLWKILGASCLGGVAVMIFMMPVARRFASYQGQIQKSLMGMRDKRVDLNNEVLGCMKVIKLQAWEIPFQERIEKLRNIELHELLRYVVFTAGTITLWSTLPLMVAMATFAAYIWSGHILDVATALTALALFDILRFPLFMLPRVINNIIEAYISAERVRDFLLAREHIPMKSELLVNNGICIEGATFAYDSKRPQDVTDTDWEIMLLKSQLNEAENEIKKSRNKQLPTSIHSEPSHVLSLKRIDLNATGQLIAIVGAVGSGKSTMINSILGEVRKLYGEVCVKGRVALCAQSPFLISGTLKDNILFELNDKPVNENLYNAALNASALTHDLKLLPGGDLCEIGEKGVTLSGGQKARVAIARAVYHDADIYLLDDPLAAVDAHVGKHLFKECIIEELLYSRTGSGKKRTVILVTNALQYLSSPHVDKILVLHEGRIEEEGTYSELVGKENSLFASYLKSFMESSVEETSVSQTNKNYMEGSSKHGVFGMLREISSSALDAFIGNSNMKEKSYQNNRRRSHSKPSNSTTVADNAVALITDEMEEREIGAVDFDVYMSWAKSAGGVWVGIFMISFYVAVEGINVLSKWWLSYWSENIENGKTQTYYLQIYAVINFCGILCIFLRIVFILLAGVRASRKIFDSLIDSIMKAPMMFFDTTPLGRIINRFAKDIYTVDEKLPDTVRSYLATMTSVISTICVICIATPPFVVCLIPIGLFYLSQQRYFSKTYREIKRIDSVARSPVYALFSETLDGLTTVRAYSASNFLKRRIITLLDDQQIAYFLTFSSQCWLAVRLELAGTAIIAFACLASVFEFGLKGGGEAFAGFAGLSISFALSVTQTLNWSVRMASDLEAHMISLERINQYARIPSEAARHTSFDQDLDKSWPSKGEIHFKNVKMRYRQNLPLVLKGLDFKIPPRSKVGVVGRTGAGKSTLAVSMLRICEVESGSIVIDSVDIYNLGLQALRSAIAIIPQDPILLSGTVRSNLDPFDSYDDAKLLQVLERVGLYNKSNLAAISSLDDMVYEGGNNFSAGQRQLLVIARALLQNAMIIIMDEATAAIDAESDAKLQLIIRSEFKNATCITIAHRLNTIMDSDYILVMDDGKAAEFDSPQELLRRGGLFKNLVDAWEDEKGSS